MKKNILHSRVVNLLVLLVAGSGVLIAAELLLQLVSFNYSPFRINRDWRLYHAFIDKSYVYDSNLFWRPQAGKGVFNQQGFIGLKLPVTKQANEYRIFTLGDSNTEGLWPFYLQKVLIKNNIMAVVTNAAVTGYSSYQGLSRFKEILAYQPDLVLISFGANDAHRVRRSDLQYAHQIVREINLDEFLVKWKIGQLMLAGMDLVYSLNRTNFVPRVSPEEYGRNLQKMVDLAGKNNIKLVFLTRPFYGESSDVNLWKTYEHIYNRLTKEIAQKNGLPCIDVYQYFRYQQRYFLDEAHFNKEGHQEAAEYIFTNIQPMLKIPAGK